MTIQTLTGTSKACWIRGVLIVGIATATALLSKPEIGWHELLFAALQGAVAWKAFLDQSLSDKPLA